MHTILDREGEKVHGLSRVCKWESAVCDQCSQLCVSSVQWMMGIVVQGEVNKSV